MNLLFLLPIPFIILSGFLFFLYRKNKKQYNDVNQKFDNLIKETKELKNPLRYGYYEETVYFAQAKGDKNTDDYRSIVYVNELDRYLNGESKIIL